MKNFFQKNPTTLVLISISFCHFLNDLIQSLLPAIYPILKESYHLTFTQIGLITLAFQFTASILQPIVGLYTDKRPRPFSLALGMTFTLIGLLILSVAGNFYSILLGAMVIGSGSSIFHPESSRIARLASKGKYGFAQSFFQVGGNVGAAMGPLLAAFIILPHGQISISWFSVLTLLGIVILFNIGKWYRAAHLNVPKKSAPETEIKFSKKEVRTAIAVLIALIFSKYFYSASINSYYTFYLIETFKVSVREAQIHLFIFLAACAAGTLLGGLLSDRFNRKNLLWTSILGALPFTLMLPYANLFWTEILTVIIGLVISSTFSTILVYAQELIPGRVGMVSGLFFGLAFGIAAIGAAVLGKLADLTNITFVYHVCSFLPAIGLLIWFLPDLKKGSRR
jgi:FSR family fosmidomycin resistance protein-like MFS transporter